MQKSVVTEIAISVTGGMNGDAKDVKKVIDSVDGSGEEGSGRVVFSTVSERTPLTLKTTSAASNTPTSWTVGQEDVKSSYGFYNPVAPSHDGYRKTEKQNTETTGEGEPFTSRLITPVLVTVMMPHNEFTNEDVQSTESHIAENIPISSSETPVTASLGQLTTSPTTTTFIGDESQSTAQEARKSIHTFLRNDKNTLEFNPTKFQGFYTEPTTAPAATKKGQLAIFDLDLSGGGDLSEVTDEPFPPSFRPAFVEELDTMETSKEIETFAITNSQSIHTTDLEPTLRQPSEQEGPKLEYNLSSIQSATDVKWRDERMVVAPIVTTTTTTTVTDSLENTPSATSVSQDLERGLVVTGRPRRSCRLGYRRSNGSCESVCSLSPTYCYNNGRCYMVEGVGPVCKCASAEFSWYRGSRCQSVVTDFQVASVAVAVGLLLFALLVFLLLAFAKRLHVLGAEIRQLRSTSHLHNGVHYELSGREASSHFRLSFPQRRSPEGVVQKPDSSVGYNG
uniref:Uncharacterized protein n=1 Tax=Eptatretus burgeri TaxID=7764 RepID=A0A8C4QZK0_EPTBU